MKKIKINYYDFGKIDAENHHFTKLLRTKYDVEISNEPDYIFYSVFGNKHQTFDGIRIFWTGENVIPNFNYCDYAIGFSELSFGDRYLRLPLWTMYKGNIDLALKKATLFTKQESLMRPFCSTVISNSKQTDGMREKIFEALSKTGTVASGGKWRNSVGGPVPDKIKFQSGYKFCLCAENTYAPGYTTEKILEAFASGCVPIYYGDPLAVQDFNPKAFINAHDYPDMDSLLARIKKIDTDNELYWSMIQEPAFLPGALEKYSDEKIFAFLDRIFAQPIDKAKRRFYFKPYQDFDYRNLKMRDLKLVLKYFLLKPFRKK